MKKVYIICGPTASGKTALAVALAQDLGTEILSADSRQVFQELNIGVSKPEASELAAVKHHFIGHVSINEDYTAGRFGKEAKEFLNTFFQNHESIVICGGTGLYIKALTEGLDRPPVSDYIRDEVNELLEEHGLAFLATMLEEKDPELAAQTNLLNPRRVQRMLEWVMADKPVSPTQEWPSDWKIIKVAIEIPREELYKRIDQRVDKMLAKGLWKEAEGFLQSQHLNALQTVGYQEIFEFFDGKSKKENAIEKIKQHTRNYAKRQITWFKKDLDIVWIEPENQADMVKAVLASQGN